MAFVLLLHSPCSTPTNCSMYYTCSAKTNGRFYQARHKCPDGTIYDLDTECCRPRAEAKCEVMSIVELLNLYEFYKHRKEQCKLNYTDDAAIEKCIKACADTSFSTTILTPQTDNVASISESTTLIPNESVGINVTSASINSQTISTESPFLSTSPEPAEDSDEENSMELLDQSTGLRPRRKKVPTTTVSSQSTTTESLEPLSSSTLEFELEKSTQCPTDESSTTTLNSEYESNGTDSKSEDPIVVVIGTTSSESNVFNTTEASSTQKIIESTTETQTESTTTLHEISGNLNTTTATPVTESSTLGYSGIATIVLNETTTTTEIVKTPTTTIASITTENGSDDDASNSSSNDRNVFTSTDLNDCSTEATTQQSQADDQASTIGNSETTTIGNDRSTETNAASIILPNETIPIENLKSDPLTRSNSNESESTSTTEAFVNTTENEKTTEQSTTKDELKSTEPTPTTVSSSEIEDNVSSLTSAPDTRIENTENIDPILSSDNIIPTTNASIDFKPTESTSEDKPNATEVPISTSSIKNDYGNTENTTPCENITSQDDEIISSTDISSTESNVDELEIINASTESNIKNGFDLTEQIPSSTTQENETPSSTESKKSDEVTTIFTAETISNLPASTTQAYMDISSEGDKPKSESLVSSTENINMTSTEEPVNTTEPQNDNKTTEQNQQNPTTTTEKLTFFDENATLSPDNGSTTENAIPVEVSTSPSQISTSDSDNVLTNSTAIPILNVTESNTSDAKANNSTTIAPFISNKTTESSSETTTSDPLISSSTTEILSSSEGSTTSRNEDESTVNSSDVITESSAYTEQTQAPNIEPPHSESLLSSDLNENQGLRNDSVTNAPFVSNTTTDRPTATDISEKEITTVASASTTVDDLTYPSTIFQNPSSLPPDTKIPPNNSPQTDLVVESLLGNNTENPINSIRTEITSAPLATNEPSNATTGFSTETTTLAATLVNLNSTFETTIPQALPTTEQPNTSYKTRSDAIIFETSTENNANTIVTENKSTTVESSTQEEEEEKDDVTDVVLESDDKTQTTPSLLELLTSTLWPSSTEQENEFTEEVTNPSTELTSTESSSTEFSSTKFTSTASSSSGITTDSTDILIQNHTEIQPVRYPRETVYHDAVMDVEIDNAVNNSLPTINLTIKENAVVKLNFTKDCC